VGEVVVLTNKGYDGLMVKGAMMGYNPDDSDDGYDRAKDAYLEGWGRPYNERTRREEQDWADEERRQRREGGW